MADVVRIAMNRRARILAEQAKLRAELAELEEFFRMAAILAQYDPSPGDDREKAGAIFCVQIAGLVSTGNAAAGGARDPASPGGNGGSAGEREMTGPGRVAAGIAAAGMTDAGRDHFEFNE